MPHYSDDELLQSLRDCKSKHGEVNTRILNEDDEFPTGPTYGYRFESFSKALKDAGLPEEASKARRRTKKTPYSEQEIIDYVTDIAEDGVITNKIISSADGPSVNTILKKLSINNINEIENCIDGVSVTTERERTVATEESVRSGLLQAAKENEKITKSLLDSNNDYPSIADIEYYYGSLREASDVLGINIHGYTPLNTISSLFDSTYIYVVRDDDELFVGYSSNLTNRLPKLSMDYDSVEKIIRVKENVSNEVDEIIEHMSNDGYSISTVHGGRETVECDNCGENFSTQSHKLKHSETNFCSVECKDEYGTEQRECVVCGNVESVRRSSYTHQDGWVCSSECNYEKYRDVVACMECGKTEQKLSSKIDKDKPHFCSNECKTNYNNIDVTCNKCGDVFTVSRTRFEEYNNHYCDLDCLHDVVNASTSSNSLDAKLQTWANKVKNREDHVCEKCGNSYDVMTAHHNPPKVTLSEEEMLDTDNGVCLCYPCHAEQHDGYTRNVLESWWDWYTTPEGGAKS